MNFRSIEKAARSEGKLAKVYAPLGLDIAADSPAEIAVSALWRKFWRCFVSEAAVISARPGLDETD